MSTSEVFDKKGDEILSFCKFYMDKLPPSELFLMVNVEFGTKLAHRDTLRYYLEKMDYKMVSDRKPNKNLDIHGIRTIVLRERAKQNRLIKG